MKKASDLSSSDSDKAVEAGLAVNQCQTKQVETRSNGKSTFSEVDQGCQMVSFRTKNPNLGKFWSALDGKMLIYFRAFWNISMTFGIFYYHLVFFVFI
jgi:hypothetical protein